MSLSAAQTHQEPPIEPGGPYSGRLSQAVGYVPLNARKFLDEVGGTSLLLVTVLWSAIRYPRGYWRDAIAEMHNGITRSWFSISLGIFGFVLALSSAAMQFLNTAGVSEYFGPLLIAQCTRTFTVWVATLLVAGVIGSAITAELGSRKVREELDALIVMGVDPIRALVVPKIVSVTLFTGLLSIPAQLITVFSAQLSARLVGGLNASEFYSFVWLNANTTDLVAMILNCFLAGLLIGTVASYKGLHAAGGATGLAKAVNQGVVTTFVAIFIMQLGYNAILLGIFPGLGSFK